MFCTIWVHPEPFGCLQTPCKTGRTSAKVRATKSSLIFLRPTHPILIFWCVSYRHGAFATIWLPCKTRGETFRTIAKVRATKSLRFFFATSAPDPPHSSLNSCFGAICTIWVHLGPFGCITKLGTKRAELGQKIVPQSRVGMVHNERTRSIP